MQLNVCLLAGLLSIPAVVSATPQGPSSAPAEPQTLPVMISPAIRYQGLISLHTGDELRTLLLRADTDAGRDNYQSRQPVAVVLHGDEIALFERSRYRENKALVDLAARLDAFGVVELKVCASWMAEHAISAGDLPPFLETVNDGPAEVRRMQLEGYASF